jgi:hypothetical protein
MKEADRLGKVIGDSAEAKNLLRANQTMKKDLEGVK